MPIFCCNRCKEIISQQDYAICSDCSGYFHFECSVPEPTYNKIIKKQKKWKCANCSDGVSTRNMKGSQKQENKFVDLENDSHFKIHDLSELNKVLLNMNAKIEELMEIKNSVNEITKSLNFISDKYDNLIEENKKLNEKIYNLENTVRQQNKNIEFLKHKTTNIEQYSRNKNIEIHGIVAKENEDCKEIVIKLAEELNIDMKSESVDVAHRLQTRVRTNAPPIIAQFTSRTIRDTFIHQKHLVITNKNIPHTEIGQKIYINENLNPELKHLLYEARLRGKANSFKYIWYKNFCIYAKKTDDDQVIKIMNAADLDKIGSITSGQ